MIYWLLLFDREDLIGCKHFSFLKKSFGNFLAATAEEIRFDLADVIICLFVSKVLYLKEGPSWLFFGIVLHLFLCKLPSSGDIFISFNGALLSYLARTGILICIKISNNSYYRVRQSSLDILYLFLLVFLLLLFSIRSCFLFLRLIVFWSNIFPKPFQSNPTNIDHNQPVQIPSSMHIYQTLWVNGSSKETTEFKARKS